MLRSYLFVPGNRPDRYDKALASRAGAVIVDLEDAVAPADKPAARAALLAWLDPAKPVIVRVNGPATEWFERDLDVCAQPGVTAVIVPKAEAGEQIARVAAASARPVLPLVETARGLWSVLDIAKASGVSRLLFGSLDYQADLDTTDDELLLARSQLVLASRVAGIGAPVDGVTQAVDDAELLRRDCERARRLGFGGKICIHPRQVDVVNRCFAPTEDDMAWARRVTNAFGASRGNATLLDGKMIDGPVLSRAQAILDEAATGGA
jgi:citrate lyase subunit beta/citryl-CoA lyase